MAVTVTAGLLTWTAWRGSYQPFGGILEEDGSDFIVPDPGNLQSFNRYSYVLNNPLKYIDPTGNFNVPGFLVVLDWWCSG